jgi:hypothetical protein
MMPPEVTMLLLIFKEGINEEEAAAFLDGFDQSSIQWAKAFSNNSSMYAMNVPTIDTTDWIETLMNTDEIVLAEIVSRDPWFRGTNPNKSSG